MMNAIKLADIKKRWKESQCQQCGDKRTLMLSPALTFIYEDAPELFEYIEKLERRSYGTSVTTSIITDVSKDGTNTRTETIP